MTRKNIPLGGSNADPPHGLLTRGGRGLVTKRISPRGPNAEKTHCPQGHPYTKENTYLNKNGRGGLSRQCRTCALERHAQRHRQAYVGRPYPPRVLKAACPQGHLYTRENTRDERKRDGRTIRRCRTCHMAQARIYRSRGAAHAKATSERSE